MRVLPTDVYDTLEFSALAFGGIGAGRWSTDDTTDSSRNGQPVCLRGHAHASDPDKHRVVGLMSGPAYIGLCENDEAVARINRRKGRDYRTRVSWKEYTRELNIVRGDS